MCSEHAANAGRVLSQVTAGTTTSCVQRIVAPFAVPSSRRLPATMMPAIEDDEMTISVGLYLPSGWGKDMGMDWFSSDYHRSLSHNKHFEWQSGYFGWTRIFSLDLDLIPTGGDHASVGFSLTVLGFMISATIYDSRHWDDDKRTWKDYSKETYDAELQAARNLIARDEEWRFIDTRQAYLASPEGLAEIAVEKARNKEEKRKRGEAYRAANLAAREPE